MTTLTFSTTRPTASQGRPAIRDFLVSWFQATPAFFIFQALTTR
ncbi:hypothetical protein [Azospirillum ramasamyi]|nr:hypothetical protein [Azospirillum ramasamyi]